MSSTMSAEGAEQQMSPLPSAGVGPGDSARRSRDPNSGKGGCQVAASERHGRSRRSARNPGREDAFDLGGGPILGPTVENMRDPRTSVQTYRPRSATCRPGVIPGGADGPNCVSAGQIIILDVEVVAMKTSDLRKRYFSTSAAHFGPNLLSAAGLRTAEGAGGAAGRETSGSAARRRQRHRWREVDGPGPNPAAADPSGS